MKQLSLVSTILTLVALILSGSWGVFWLLEERHAAKQEVIALKKDLITSKAEDDLEDSTEEIDELNKLRVYYDDKKLEGTLDNADARRLQFVNEKLTRAYEKEKRLRDRLDRLEEDK